MFAARVTDRRELLKVCWISILFVTNWEADVVELPTIRLGSFFFPFFCVCVWVSGRSSRKEVAIEQLVRFLMREGAAKSSVGTSLHLFWFPLPAQELGGSERLCAEEHRRS